MQVREGYIRNPWSKEHDGIHVSAVIKRIEEEAHRGCGLHYEIFERRSHDGLINVLNRLNEEDRALLLKEANGRGYSLDADSLDKIDAAYNDVMSKIIKEQI